MGNIRQRPLLHQPLDPSDRRLQNTKNRKPAPLFGHGLEAGKQARATLGTSSKPVQEPTKTAPSVPKQPEAQSDGSSDDKWHRESTAPAASLSAASLLFSNFSWGSHKEPSVSANDVAALSSIPVALKIPWHMEQCVMLGMAASLDYLLHMFTLLPMRVAFSLLTGLVGIFTAATGSGDGRPAERAVAVRRSQLFDLLRVGIGVLSVATLAQFEVSWLYHTIRGEGAPVKLYLLFNILEVVEKLLSSMGLDVFASVHRAVVMIRAPPTSSISAAVNSVRLLWAPMLGAVIITAAHSAVMFVQIVCLSVALNSHSKTLPALLISNNFAEIKSSVLKRFNPVNLFQVVCADIVERFHLTLFLLLVTVQEAGSMDRIAGMLPGAAIVLSAEALVDWTKHYFLCKFNGVDPTNFQQAAAVIAYDVVTVRTFWTFTLDPTHMPSRRLGLATLPLACVVFRFLWLRFGDDFGPRLLTLSGLSFALAVWVMMLVFKLALSTAVLAYTRRYVSQHVAIESQIGVQIDRATTQQEADSTVSPASQTAQYQQMEEIKEAIATTASGSQAPLLPSPPVLSSGILPPESGGAVTRPAVAAERLSAGTPTAMALSGFSSAASGPQSGGVPEMTLPPSLLGPVGTSHGAGAVSDAHQLSSVRGVSGRQHLMSSMLSASNTAAPPSMISASGRQQHQVHDDAASSIPRLSPPTPPVHRGDSAAPGSAARLSRTPTIAATGYGLDGDATGMHALTAAAAVVASSLRRRPRLDHTNVVDATSSSSAAGTGHQHERSTATGAGSQAGLSDPLARRLYPNSAESITPPSGPAAAKEGALQSSLALPAAGKTVSPVRPRSRSLPSVNHASHSDHTGTGRAPVEPYIDLTSMSRGNNKHLRRDSSTRQGTGQPSAFVVSGRPPLSTRLAAPESPAVSVSVWEGDDMSEPDGQGRLVAAGRASAGSHHRASSDRVHASSRQEESRAAAPQAVAAGAPPVPAPPNAWVEPQSEGELLLRMVAAYRFEIQPGSKNIPQ